MDISKIKNIFSKIGYHYYFDDNLRHDKRGVNCYDEVHDRLKKVHELMGPQPIIDGDVVKTIGITQKKLHDLLVEELMSFNGWSKQKAINWVNVNFVFTNVKLEDGYVTVSPVARKDYDELVREACRFDE